MNDRIETLRQHAYELPIEMPDCYNCGRPWAEHDDDDHTICPEYFPDDPEIVALAIDPQDDADARYDYLTARWEEREGR